MFSFGEDNKSSSKTPLGVGPATIDIVKVYDTDQDGRRLLSKNGNPMIKVLLKARDEMGGEGLINEYIPLIPRMKWKAQQLVDCFGVPEAFSGGTLNTEMLMYKKGRCMLHWSESAGYAPKIAVEQYIAASKDIKTNMTPTDTKDLYATTIEKDADFDDEIPF
jgi:hypothetical protein